MGKIETTVMWQDDQLLGNQARLIAKHFRCYFPSKMIVPFYKIYYLINGYTKPRVKILNITYTVFGRGLNCGVIHLRWIKN